MRQIKHSVVFYSTACNPNGLCLFAINLLAVIHKACLRMVAQAVRLPSRRRAQKKGCPFGLAHLSVNQMTWENPNKHSRCGFTGAPAGDVSMHSRICSRQRKFWFHVVVQKRITKMTFRGGDGGVLVGLLVWHTSMIVAVEKCSSLQPN